MRAKRSNLKRDDGFFACYVRDCHRPEFALSAAEGGLAMRFCKSFLQSKLKAETLCEILQPQFCRTQSGVQRQKPAGHIYPYRSVAISGSLG